MTIKVRRGDEELSADIINASIGGCLLRMQAPLEKGVALDVNIPMLNLTQARLYVLRCEPAPEGGGFMVATCFDELATESEDFIRETSDEQRSKPKKPTGG
jgi:hypothetical protein